MRVSLAEAAGGLFFLLLSGGGSSAAAAPCSSSTLVAPSVVQDTAGALQLAEAIDCSGGDFNVTWEGSVAVEDTIRVSGGTVLSVVGLPDGSSVVDGGGAVQPFRVSGGGLRLSGLSLVNGAASEGGSIYAYNASVVAAGCVFHGNEAERKGGAYFGFASVLRSDGCEFSGNSANFGGGIYLYGDSAVHATDSVFRENVASNYGGGAHIELSELTAEGCEFSDNFADFGGAMWVFNNSVVHATGSAFVGNDALKYGGGAHVRDSVLILADCGLSRNNASILGGAVHAESTSVNVSGSTAFEDNVAGTGGGGMYLGASHLEVLAGDDGGEDSGALFSGNRAGGAGAGAYLMGSSLSLGGRSTFTNNSAGSSGGGMYVEAAYHFRAEGARFSDNSAGTTGGAMSLLSVGTAEADGDSAKVVFCSFDENVASDAGGAVYVAGGFVDFNRSDFDGNVAGNAGGAILAAGTADLDACALTNNRAPLGSAVSNVVALHLRHTEFRGNSLLCDDTRFFLDWKNASAYETACDECPEECEGCAIANPDEVLLCESVFDNTNSLTADGTLETLNLAPGYWRSSNRSRQIRACPRAESCLGGTEGRCAAGYGGPFCAVCADGYSLGLGYTCSACDEGRKNFTTAVAVIMAVFTVLAVVVSVRYLGAPAKEPAAERIQSVVQDHFERSRVSQGLKIIIVSWQIVSQFSSVASVVYPDLYETFVGYLDILDLDLLWMLSTDCWVDTNFYDTLLAITIGPLAVSALLLASYVIRIRGCRPDDADRRSRINQRHATFMYLISFLVYASASSAVFQTFACDGVDTGASYLRVDHSIQCFTTEHRLYTAYAGLMCLVYPLGIPFTYAVVLYKARRGLKPDEEEGEGATTSTDVAALRPLWQPYRRSVYYYEVVECFRRVTLSGLVVFILPDTAGQVMTAFLLSLAFFALFTVLYPYADARDTWLARIGHAIVMMSMFVALAVKLDVEGDDGFSQDVFAGALILVNVVMVLTVVVEALGMCSVVVRDIRDSVPTATGGVEGFGDELPQIEGGAQIVPSPDPRAHDWAKPGTGGGGGAVVL